MALAVFVGQIAGGATCVFGLERRRRSRYSESVSIFKGAFARSLPIPGIAHVSKVRLDALTDGIFAVAMTILVLDLRLPEDFHPADDGAMAHALLGLWPKFLPYALSFYVLGSIWLAAIKLRSRAEFFDKQYVSWWLVQLLLATCLPFSKFGHRQVCEPRSIGLVIFRQFGRARSRWASAGYAHARHRG